MRNLLSTLMILALAAPAIAVLNSDPDQVGIYFDLDADINSMNVNPSEPFMAYVILTNSNGSQFEAFAFRYRIEIAPELEPMFFRLASWHPPGAIVLWCEPPESLFDCQISWGFPTPRPIEPATIVYYWQFMIVEPLAANFYLEPGDIGLVYQADGELRPMHPVSGSYDVPVATINGDPVVPTKARTFGTLKALYR